MRTGHFKLLNYSWKSTRQSLSSPPIYCPVANLKCCYMSRYLWTELNVQLQYWHRQSAGMSWACYWQNSSILQPCIYPGFLWYCAATHWTWHLCLKYFSSKVFRRMTAEASPDPTHILPNGHWFQLHHLDDVLEGVIVKVDKHWPANS